MPKKLGYTDNTLYSIYQALFDRYGNLNWWPAKTPFEVIVGAVLTQNTAWSNVEKAIANFGGVLTSEAVLEIDLEKLAEIIHPAGFFNQKAAYLKSVTQWFARYGFDVPSVRRKPLESLRKELLAVRGVGKETADSILLYAFGFPTFVVDAYTMRLCERYPIKIPSGLRQKASDKGYDSIKKHFEDNLPKSVDLYNNFHALIVINGKEHCRKKSLCDGCPLAGDGLGVDLCKHARTALTSSS